MTLLSFSKRDIRICLILVAIAHFHKCFGANPVCKTDECKKLGALYLSNIDQNVTPCMNFYKYACGGWEQKYAKLLGYNNWDFNEEMQETVYLDLRKLLEAKSGSDAKDVKMAKEIYSICKNAPYFERIEGPALLQAVTKIASWPMIQLKNKYLQFTLPLNSIDKQFIRTLGQSAFYDYKILSEEPNHQKIVTELRGPVTPYGVIRRMAEWRPQELKHYKTFITLVLQNIMPNYKSLPQDQLAKEIDQVIKFRENFRKIIRETHPFVSTKMTIQEFQQWYNTKALKRKTAEINWFDVIRAIYKSENPRSSTITPVSLVVVNKKYFSKLADLLAQTSMTILVNHLHLYFVERHIKFNQSMQTELKSSISDGIHPTGKIVYEPRRWKKCIEYINMKKTLGQMYLQATFPAAKKANIEKLLSEGKDILVNQIANSNWVNNHTKAATINKVKNIKGVIGATDFSVWGQSGHTTNSIDIDLFYNMGRNTVYASAGFLQFPMYVESAPFVVKYASTMSVLGHELYHSVDPDGIQFTVNGDYPFWLGPMKSDYNKQSQCFRKQFEAFKHIDLRKRGLNPAEETLGYTLNEDISDAMGLKLAYIAYKQKLKENKGVCPVLPGFVNIGCDKLFFIAFANVHCTHMTTQTKDKELLNNEHSLPEIRVNGAVSNLWQFSAIFGCKVDDPLKKPSCDLWQRLNGGHS